MFSPRWLATFPGFPLGGLTALTIVGPVDGPLTAAAAGLLGGTVLGTAQWLALRPRGVGRRWIAATAAAMAAGSAVAAAVTGAGTALGDLLVTGAVAGTAVGAAQGWLLSHDPAARLTWTAVTATAWTLGWLATWSIGVDVERGYIVFGAAGAIVATVLTGLALRRVAGAAPAPPSAAAAVTA